MIRLSKRTDGMSTWSTWLIRISSILVALLLGALLLTALGYPPIRAYGTIIRGSLGSLTFVRQTVKIAIPLLGCALAIAPCFKMRFWNIGAEGQITAGGIGATLVVLLLADKLPQVPLLLLMALGAIVCGAIWGLIPGFFKARWNTNETLFTLMMNYIVIGIVKWLQGGPWEGAASAVANGSQQIGQFPANAKLPTVLGVHCGWIIVLLLTVFIFIYMNYSKHGFEIAIIGDSHNTARYAGIHVGGVMMRTMALSGGISGLVGFIIVSGANHTLYDSVADGVGFTAITVAWLANLNPLGMILIAMLLAVLDKGSQTLYRELSVPATIAEILTGLILLCMLASEFFISYKLSIRRRKEA